MRAAIASVRAPRRATVARRRRRASSRDARGEPRRAAPTPATRRERPRAPDSAGGAMRRDAGRRPMRRDDRCADVATMRRAIAAPLPDVRPRDARRAPPARAQPDPDIECVVHAAAGAAGRAATRWRAALHARTRQAAALVRPARRVDRRGSALERRRAGDVRRDRRVPAARRSQRRGEPRRRSSASAHAWRARADAAGGVRAPDRSTTKPRAPRRSTGCAPTSTCRSASRSSRPTARRSPERGCAASPRRRASGSRPSGRFECVQRGDRRGPVHAAELSRSEPFTRRQPARTSTPRRRVRCSTCPASPIRCASFDQMKLAAKRMAHTLGGELVDDNRRPLNDAALASIRAAGAGCRRGARAKRTSNRAARARCGCSVGLSADAGARRTSPRRSPQRAAALRAAIDAHNHRYYVLDAPTVSDAEYDAAVSRAAGARERAPGARHARFADAARRRRAAPASSTPVTHRVPMLSLDNAFTDDEVEAFDRRVREALGADAVEYAAEPKFDGLAISLAYENGVFVRRRDARRRRDRRERHARTCARSARSRCALAGRSRRRCSRCAARC